MKREVRIEKAPPILVAWDKSEGTFLKMSKERIFEPNAIDVERLLSLILLFKVEQRP